MDFETFKKDFADTLRQLRNERKISAREMSLELGQNVNYINYIETGRHLPSMQGFFLICDYFGIQPSDFLKSQKENNEDDSDDMTFFSKLSKRQQKSIVTMIKEFLNAKQETRLQDNKLFR